MRLTRQLFGAIALMATLAWHGGAFAQSGSADAAAYTKKGADTCLGCHDSDDGNYAVGALFNSKHAHRGNARSPFGPGGLQCEACHGPGAEHARRKKASAINTFKADSSWTLEQRNGVCMSCHENASRTGWHASAHQRAELACTDCHQVHRAHGDPMLSKARESQTCMNCHKSQRADFHKPSTHPVLGGQMACSSCHAPHGSGAPAMLAKATLNQTCYSCHADKRGPVLWEHAPVAEDCSLCHNPHGSVRTALLNKSTPMLCQSCHSAAGHPSVAVTGAALPANGGAGAAFAIAGACTNCHTQVHGSNHPSGSKLMR